MAAAGPPVASRRVMGRSRSGRPWLLIVAALLLAALSTVLWLKWTDSRVRAERLQAELKQVYGEAERLRMQAARAQQRITQFEEQLRSLQAERPKGTPREEAREPKAATKPKPDTGRPPEGR